MKRPSPSRPDWRDPNMISYELSKTRGVIELTPEEKQRLSQRRLEGVPAPCYKDDPTYNLRRKLK